MIIKGTTGTGFPFEINKDLLADAEFLELFAEVQNGGTMKTFALIKKALGDDQKSRLYDHCRNDAGIVPVDALTGEIADIFGALNENPATKN